MNCEQLENEKTRILTVLREDASRVLIPLIRKMLDDARVVAVMWHQYTPSWNDGDPCTFTLDERVVLLHPDFLKCWRCRKTYVATSVPDVCPVSQDGVEYRCEIDDDIDPPIPCGGVMSPGELGEDEHVADELLEALEPVLQFVFGDDVQVVARLDDDEVVFDVSSYSCGY